MFNDTDISADLTPAVLEVLKQNALIPIPVSVCYKFMKSLSGPGLSIQAETKSYLFLIYFKILQQHISCCAFNVIQSEGLKERHKFQNKRCVFKVIKVLT